MIAQPMEDHPSLGRIASDRHPKIGRGAFSLHPLRALLPLLPFLSYVLSFIYIGIYWNNHHHLKRETSFGTVRRSIAFLRRLTKSWWKAALSRKRP